METVKNQYLVTLLVRTSEQRGQGINTKAPVFPRRMGQKKKRYTGVYWTMGLTGQTGD